ncbi:cupin domain-containing protein [Myroides injenensis]|uniref:cupin domain-containing protein n=1 Tax=Myroides injenensis TaxID=1183151 RepID=UPI0002886DF0|nr:cupin domain-containing protein [Myroides injenensis]
MQIINILSDIVYGETKPAIKVLIDTTYIKEIRIVFKIGQEMKQHKTDYPIVIHIIEGKINFGVETERFLLNKGDIITLDAGVPHDLIAEEDSIIRLSLNKADKTERVNQLLNQY